MPSLVNDELLDAIAYAETRGSKDKANAVGDTKLGANQAVGKFQMRPIAYKDVQRLHPKEYGSTPFEALKGNLDFQRKAGMQYLADLEQHYGFTDFDSLVAAYNAGPTAIKKRGIFNREYVDTVKRAMRGGGKTMTPEPSLGDYVEQGIRKINKMAQDTGFGPLNVKEIMQILGRVVPAAPINNAKPKQSPVPGVLQPYIEQMGAGR